MRLAGFLLLAATLGGFGCGGGGGGPGADTTPGETIGDGANPELPNDLRDAYGDGIHPGDGGLDIPDAGPGHDADGGLPDLIIPDGSLPDGGGPDADVANIDTISQPLPPKFHMFGQAAGGGQARSGAQILRFQVGAVQGFVMRSPNSRLRGAGAVLVQ